MIWEIKHLLECLERDNHKFHETFSGNGRGIENARSTSTEA